MKFILLLTLFCITTISLASNSITGMAPAHVGDKVRLLRYDDYITRKTVEIVTSTVLSDSTFSLSFQTDETFEALLEIGDSYGVVYIQPDAEYKILFPKVESGHRLSKNYVSLIFEEAPAANDINSMILYLDQRIDGFVQVTASGYHDGDSIGKPKTMLGQDEWREELKGFKDHLTHLYDSIDNTFFIEYMVFSIANLELLGSTQNSSIGLNKEGVYHAYIHKAPFLPGNNAYMKLINNFYSNIFSGFIDTSRQILKNIILEDPKALQNFMSEHMHYSRKDLGELLMIKALGEAYISNKYPRSSIINILEKLKKDCVETSNQKLAGNVLKYLTNLRKGYPAPQFNVPSAYGDSIKLTEYQGKYLYISFFETWCTQCQVEFEIMVKLKERYGKNVHMLSICMDSDKANLEKFLRKNPQYTWDFAWAGDQPQLLEYYDISNYPIYFLLDKDGNILQAPALTPSPKGNYESIDRTMHNLNRQSGSGNTNRLGPPKPPDHRGRK